MCNRCDVNRWSDTDYYHNIVVLDNHIHFFKFRLSLSHIFDKLDIKYSKFLTVYNQDFVQVLYLHNSDPGNCNVLETLQYSKP